MITKEPLDRIACQRDGLFCPQRPKRTHFPRDGTKIREVIGVNLNIMQTFSTAYTNRVDICFVTEKRLLTLERPDVPDFDGSIH